MNKYNKNLFQATKKRKKKAVQLYQSLNTQDGVAAVDEDRGKTILETHSKKQTQKDGL